MKEQKSAPAKIKRQTLNLWPEAGKVLGLGRNSTYAAAQRGDLRIIRIGRRLLVPIAEIDRLLKGSGSGRPIEVPQKTGKPAA